jgi:hypothetical protein
MVGMKKLKLKRKNHETFNLGNFNHYWNHRRGYCFNFLQQVALFTQIKHMIYFISKDERRCVEYNPETGEIIGLDRAETCGGGC